MPKLIEGPSIVEAAGNEPKIIREDVGWATGNGVRLSTEVEGADR